MWIGNIIVLATTALGWCSASVPDLTNGRPCCPEDNVFHKHRCVSSMNNTRIQLNCHWGMYSLDPAINPNDAYSITDEGKLANDGTESYRDSFCTTNEMFDPNNTRPVALVCFTHEEDDYSASLPIFRGILFLISVMFIVATLYVYYLIPELRETQDKVTCIALSCMMVFYLLLGILQFAMDDIICIPFGVSVYFFIMAYFSWMNIVMLNVWKTSVGYRWKIQERTWYMLCHVYGWTIPTLLLVVVWVDVDLHFNTNSCFFKHQSSMILMYMPMTIMLLLNAVLFAWSAWAIHMSGRDVSADKKKALAYKLKLYVQLMILAGITWIFEILSAIFNVPNYELSVWIAADIVNALLGCFVFLVLVVWRRRICKELAGKRILCFKVPSKWAEGVNCDETLLSGADQGVVHINDHQNL